MPTRVRTRTSAGTVPVPIIAPTISGTQTVGQTLTCNPGIWAGLNPLTFTFQWLRDAATAIGTNQATYVLVAGDSTHTVKCQVTVSNALGSSAPVQTAPTGTIP